MLIPFLIPIILETETLAINLNVEALSLKGEIDNNNKFYL